MAEFCIIPELAIKLREAGRRGEIPSPSVLFDMTSEQRRDVFKKYTDLETAKNINTSFEKAMVSTSQTALRDWVNQTFNAEVKKRGGKKDAIEKILELDEKGLLTPEDTDAFLEDLVADKLGVTISAQDAEKISGMVKELEELEKDTSEIGLPKKEYWKKKAEIDAFIQEQSPASNLRVATSTIGRGMMLASVKSPIINIESNTVQGILTAFERRVMAKRAKGLNGDFARKFVKENMAIYQASGYDPSRFMSQGGDKKIRGEDITHSQGKGVIRWVGRGVEDTVFKQLMGAPDVAFASVHFADSANLASSNIAKSEGLSGEQAQKRALEIFKDAIQIEPTTVEGQLVKAQAEADATYATYTNKSTYSDVALAIRGVLNTASGDARLGDQVMPFVKTPANVVGAGIDYSGIALPLQAYLLPKALIQAKQGDPEALRRSARAFVRAGLGMVFAFALSNLFEADEFIGNYPTTKKEQELLDMKNATTNSVKIGNKWVSLDYLGVLSAPFIGMMYAKKYGHNPTEDILKYYQGVGIQAQKFPGIREFSDIVKEIQELTDEAKTGQEELLSGATNKILDYIRSRTVPAIVNDTSIATDTSQREADIKEDPLARIKASIPGLRSSLPEKETILGDTKKAEPGWSQILFGSRVKTANENAVLQEFERLDKSDNLPSITNVEETSTRVKAFKEQVDEKKYNQAIDYYQNLFKVRTEKLIQTGKYKSKSDEEKAKMINDTKNEALDDMLKKYRYKEKKEKK